MHNFLLTAVVATTGLVFLAQAQSQALNDPAIHGMRVLPRVEGCNVPGGLQPITSSDGPNDAMFWCGAPPYCLTMSVGSPERCHIIPGSRNGGANGVRNPLDLRCDVTGAHPTGPTHATPGRCPAPAPAPTIQVIFSPTNPTVNTRVQVRTRTTHASSLTWSCIGRWGNRNTARAVGGWVSSNHNVSGLPGTANCTFTAVGPGGSRSANASWTSVASGGGSGSTGGGSDPVLIGLRRDHHLAEVCAEGHINRSVRNLPAHSVYSNGVMRVYIGSQLARTIAVVNGVARWQGPTTKDRYIASVSTSGINVQQYSHNIGFCTGT